MSGVEARVNVLIEGKSEMHQKQAKLQERKNIEHFGLFIVSDDS